MNAFRTDVRRSLAPARGSKDGLTSGRERLLGVTAAVQAVLFAAAVIMAALTGATGAKAARRLISVAAMLLGALIGAVGVIHVRVVFPLVIALLILVAVTLTAIARSRVPAVPDTAV